MSLKKLYFDKNIKICYTCKFIDEYACDVYQGKRIPPHGYDGTCVCCRFNDKEKESKENRCFISGLWKACLKYEKCTIRQAAYEEIFDNTKQTVIPNPYLEKIMNET